MTDDFEHLWHGRLTQHLDAALGEEARRAILAGGDELCDASSPRDIIAWTRAVVDRLQSGAGPQNTERLLSACACQYPQPSLADVRARYAESGDVAAAHQMLQSRFEAFLEKDLGLESGLRKEIVARGWGLAGVLEGRTILATKMPKSGPVREYFAERDGRRRRALYCHCPRVRLAPLLDETLPRTYCCCGAGFYKGIWEHILGRPVRVEVLSSVLSGDEQCSVAIHLPDSIRARGGP